jgi:hypothetical protein
MFINLKKWYNQNMTLHSLTTVSNSSATLLTPPGAHSGMDITLQNVNPSGYIYVGGEGVTSSNYGFRIMPNHSISFELASNDALYAISSANSMNVAIVQIGLEP